MSDRAPMDHEFWDELAAAHALHALDETDTVTFLLHASDCARCQESVRGFELVSAHLGWLAEDAGHPPAWRDIAPALAAAPVPVVDLAARRRHWGRRVLAAVAAAVLVGGGVAAWQLSTAPNPRLAVVSACRQQPGCRVVELRSNSADLADVIVRGSQASVVPLAMQPPSGEHMYVLWQMPRSGEPIPLASFRLSNRETADAPLGTSYAQTAAFAVSLEPAGALPAHPTRVLAVGQTS